MQVPPLPAAQVLRRRFELLRRVDYVMVGERRGGGSQARQVDLILHPPLVLVGLPLVLAGDEVGNSQNGNNNAYCQDNEVGWVDWQGLGREGDDLTDFIGQMIELRRKFPQIRSQRWLDGRRPDGSYGVLWLRPDAEDMKEADWKFPEGRFLAYVLAPVKPETVPIFIVLNAAPEEITFKLPKLSDYKSWRQVLNTADSKKSAAEFASGADTKAPPRAVLAFAGAV